MRNNTTDLGKELCLLNEGDRVIKEFKAENPWYGN